jgi:hypothetical protein
LQLIGATKDSPVEEEVKSYDFWEGFGPGSDSGASLDDEVVALSMKSCVKKVIEVDSNPLERQPPVSPHLVGFMMLRAETTKATVGFLVEQSAST